MSLWFCPAKHEGTISDLEERLIKEQQARQEFERSKRKLDTELSDIREQLNEKKTYTEELQIQLSRREEEVTHAMMKVLPRLLAFTNCPFYASFH